MRENDSLFFHVNIFSGVFIFYCVWTQDVEKRTLKKKKTQFTVENVLPTKQYYNLELCRK